ncbi:MAG TPA: PQQ-binding-like beta-propeller repeat protein, partial [Pirellulales bacterium]
FPFALTVSTLWMAGCKYVWRNASPMAQRLGLCALIVATFGLFDLVRWDGLYGNQRSAFAWRWVPTAEEEFLSIHQQASDKPALDAASLNQAKPLTLQPGDWAEFRGPNRDSQVHGVKLATDWKTQPPKELWRHRVGPAWSSMIVVDGKLFTQEQRGEKEAVVCYDATTGDEVWSHEDVVRFYDPLSGAGPRGTPTFSDGKIDSLGGTGRLNCLDAATGKVVWAHDVPKDADAEVAPGGFGMRQWGYSNSPLVIADKVIVFGGGEHGKSLLAYRADNGEPIWNYASGSDGYSSPQLISVAGRPQIVIHSNAGLAAVEPTDGKMLWNQPSTAAMFLPITQPQLVGDGALLAQSENGVQLVSLNQDNDHWTAVQKWDSKALKPSLNDYVVCGNGIYGFDDGVFCCLDLETGKRRWKGGRYGHGQVLLIADQPLLLVLSETGEAVLIAPNEKQLDELCRCQVIEGKTWNHPIVAEGRLYARNGEEMACFELPLEKTN